MKIDFNEAFVQSSGELSTRRVMAHEEKLMLVHMTFHKKNEEMYLHSHPHEQIVYVIKGRIHFTNGSESYELGAGDSVYIAPDVEHGAKILEDDTHALDIFTPRRDDFLTKA
jgi:quercetin dioxygenase-like cupin family protein